MPSKNRFASLEDPETSGRADEEPVTLTTGYIGVSSTSKTQRPASKPVALTTGVLEISEPAAELGARERRPYGGIAETKESFERSTATPPAASPYSSNAQELLQSENPLINAIIESSRAQVESMAAEIIQWKRKVDEKDAELAYLRDATRRLLAERQEFDDQIKAIRKIVEVKPEVRELPTLRQDLPPSNSKTQDKTESKPVSTNVKPESKTNGHKTPAYNKPAVNPYFSTTSDDPKPKRAPQRYYKPRKPNPTRTEPRRRQKTIFDLPKEAISLIVFHLSPPPPNPLHRSDPVLETSPLFDNVWNPDLENWSRTCVRFSRILRGWRWRVLRFDDEDPIGWHARIEKMPSRIRPLVQ